VMGVIGVFNRVGQRFINRQGDVVNHSGPSTQCPQPSLKTQRAWSSLKDRGRSSPCWGW
jgi:hypothetical protein